MGRAGIHRGSSAAVDYNPGSMPSGTWAILTLLLSQPFLMIMSNLSLDDYLSRVSSHSLKSVF